MRFRRSFRINGHEELEETFFDEFLNSKRPVYLRPAFSVCDTEKPIR